VLIDIPVVVKLFDGTALHFRVPGGLGRILLVPFVWHSRHAHANFSQCDGNVSAKPVLAVGLNRAANTADSSLAVPSRVPKAFCSSDQLVVELLYLALVEGC
jgi:hypothetical protein